MANPYRMRCPECRTRRTDPHAMLLHVLRCKRPLCDCGGYPWKHRPTGGMCYLNTDNLALHASWPGITADEFADLKAEIAFDTAGKPGKECPF